MGFFVIIFELYRTFEGSNVLSWSTKYSFFMWLEWFVCQCVSGVLVGHCTRTLSQTCFFCQVQHIIEFSLTFSDFITLLGTLMQNKRNILQHSRDLEIKNLITQAILDVFFLRYFLLSQLNYCINNSFISWFPQKV